MAIASVIGSLKRSVLAGEAGVYDRTQVSDQERQSGNGDRGAGLEVVKVAHAV